MDQALFGSDALPRIVLHQRLQQMNGRVVGLWFGVLPASTGKDGEGGGGEERGRDLRREALPLVLSPRAHLEGGLQSRKALAQGASQAARRASQAASCAHVVPAREDVKSRWSSGGMSVFRKTIFA